MLIFLVSIIVVCWVFYLVIVYFLLFYLKKGWDILSLICDFDGYYSLVLVFIVWFKNNYDLWNIGFL